MALNLTDEQRILQESAGRLVGDLRGDRVKPAPFDRRTWRRIAEAGWLAIEVPEEAGGLGLGGTELALVLEACGRGLLLEPVGAVAIAAGGIAQSGNGSAILAPILAGERIVMPVLAGAAIEASTSGGDAVLTGTVSGVPVADAYLVEAKGVLCFTEGDAAGLSHKEAQTVDGAGTGVLTLYRAPGRVLASGYLAAYLARRMLDRLLLGNGAELLGVMEKALELALDYVKMRRQFDRPIGSFQAIQHRAVTAYCEVELTRSLLYQVAAATDSNHGSAALVSAVKAKASAAALAVTRSAIQMHGAIGYTGELAVGWHLKRAMTLAARYGNDAAHRARYGRLIGL